MKITVLITLALGLAGNALQAQERSGKAHYESSSRIRIQKKGSGTLDEQQVRKLERDLESTYVLEFNAEESRYFQPKREQEKNVLYKNRSGRSYVRRVALQDHLYRVEDRLVRPDWMIGEERKHIAGIECVKATWTRLVARQDVLADERRDNRVLKTTVAWFAPSIEVPDGPSIYWGLPGLILEVQEDNYTLRCTALHRTANGHASLRLAPEGQVVDQAAFMRHQVNYIQGKLKEQNEEKGSSVSSITIHLEHELVED